MTERSTRTPLLRRLRAPRALALLGAGLVATLLVVYAAAALVVYGSLSKVSPGEGRHAGNTPVSFTVRRELWKSFDTSTYRMPRFDTVRVASREEGIELECWHVEREGDAASAPSRGAGPAPAVVLVHGLGECKASDAVLLPAGMLFRGGMSVLLVDVRDCGGSDIEDGRTAIGNEEYLDVLGAWDWLVEKRGVPPARVGLFGVSLGAATALIAAGEEPRVAAVFADSSFADVKTVIDEELERNGCPAFLSSGGILMARLVAGDDLLSLSPERAMRKLGGRPVFVTHGLEDLRVRAHHGRRLVQAAVEEGVGFTAWLVPASGHVEAMVRLPGEYEERLVGFFTEALGGGRRRPAPPREEAP